MHPNPMNKISISLLFVIMDVYSKLLSEISFTFYDRRKGSYVGQQITLKIIYKGRAGVWETRIFSVNQFVSGIFFLAGCA